MFLYNQWHSHTVVYFHPIPDILTSVLNLYLYSAEKTQQPHGDESKKSIRVYVCEKSRRVYSSEYVSPPPFGKHLCFAVTGNMLVPLIDFPNL